MTDFDCTEPTCTTPDLCLEQARCCALSVPERNQRERLARVKQTIAGIRERHLR